MKVCTKCNNEKPESEYALVHPAKMDGRLRPDCKECCRERSRRQRTKDGGMVAFKVRMEAIHEQAIQTAKDWTRAYLLEHPCMDCGETDLDVLDFDHVSGTKVCEVSRMISRGYRIWRIKAEVAKCEVRCANDHRRVTAKRRRENASQVFMDTRESSKL